MWLQNDHGANQNERMMKMRLSRLNIKKINLNDIDKNYSGQDILMKLGELYQFESGIYGYGNLWTKIERHKIKMNNLLFL